MNFKKFCKFKTTMKEIAMRLSFAAFLARQYRRLSFLWVKIESLLLTIVHKKNNYLIANN